MRPATHDTRPSSRRRFTLAAALGLSLMLTGSVEVQARNARAGSDSTMTTRTTTATEVTGTRTDGKTGGATLGGIMASANAAATTASSYSVNVNLSRQRATLYKGGSAISTFRISSGKKGWRTPTGTYSIYFKRPGWRKARLGLLYKPAYFVGGYAIHGSNSVPSYPASHGCIRVSIGQMDYLAPRLPIGTRVKIYY